MLRIAAITSPPLRKLMESLVSDLGAYCELTVFEAQSERGALEIYESEGTKYDAVVFTEQILMICATKNGNSITVPCFAFDDFAADLSPVLYGLLVKDRAFNFSKVSIDVLPSSGNDKGYDAFFPENQKPYYLDDGFSGILVLDDTNYCLLMNKILHWHVSHYRSGKTAFALTRFGMIAHELASAGIPHAYIMPAKEYILNFIIQTTGSLIISSAYDQKLAVVALRFFGREASEYAHFADTVAFETRTAGFESSVFHYPDKLEVTLRYKDLAELTRDFTVFPTFNNIFGDDIAEKISAGIGTGNTLFQARMNAAQALSVSGMSNRTFHVSHTGQLTGPLGRPGREYPAVPDKGLLELAEKYGIDHVALQHLRAYTNVTNTNTITAAEYAQFSDISRRTANRILTKLTQSGGARAYNENAGGKGRPKLRYQLLFD